MERICPLCQTKISAQNYSRHLKRCEGTGIKVYIKQTLDSFECQYCHKVCKNLNSLRQHECRCPLNPNRKDWEKLKEIGAARKGATKETNEVVARSTNTLKQKYKDGYVSPKKGKTVERHYIYKDHNDKEIAKWLEYTELKEIIPLSDENKVFRKEYIYVKGCVNQSEQNYIMQQLLDKWTKENIVHHINGIKTDNSKKNLLTFIDSNNHKRFHNSDYAYLIYNENTHLFSCELRK